MPGVFQPLKVRRVTQAMLQGTGMEGWGSRIPMDPGLSLRTAAVFGLDGMRLRCRAVKVADGARRVSWLLGRGGNSIAQLLLVTGSPLVIPCSTFAVDDWPDS